ncbi:LacI family DNA-binding transcriptional regulator [Caproicibacter sp.]|uniref:LacI family DNA-binding transcriptional regulator n=1 Tax=Caproicibacter sp. TaxID=2814884 RepID=UPI003988B57C
MKIGIRDVAKHAGVSAATVSHVINNTRFVSEDTRKRVLDSIKELGYFPDQMARVFKTGRRNLIGIVVPDIANLYWASVIESVEITIAAKGYKLIIISTKETENREQEGIRMVASGVVDGLIIASTQTDFSQIKKLVPKGFPMVFIDRILNSCPCDTIVTSDYDAIYQGMERLIQKGHKKIGHIAGLARLSPIKSRMKIYKEVMREHDFPIETGFVQYVEDVFRSAAELVPVAVQAGCTALLISNHVMTDDIFSYCDEHGLDIDLLGYSQAAFDYKHKRMDLIKQPCEELGRWAGSQILQRIDDPGTPVKNIVIPSVLIQRRLVASFTH